MWRFCIAIGASPAVFSDIAHLRAIRQTLATRGLAMWELFGLFWAAFLSATILPGSSEAALLALMALGSWPLATLIAVATIANTLGSVVNWWLGLFVERFREHRRFPVKPADFERYQNWYKRWGVWSLLLAWVPVVGDPLTVMAGVMRTPLWQFILVTGVGKLARYLIVAGGFQLMLP
jgi:membrane protein YqaA with SNARE-associated domain